MRSELKTKFDIPRQIKRSTGIYSCDLNPCYDRMVHSFTVLVMQLTCSLEASVVSMFNTIQEINHVVRTSYGDSNQSFGGKEW